MKKIAIIEDDLDLLENISCNKINFGTKMTDFYQNVNKILSGKVNEQ